MKKLATIPPSEFFVEDPKKLGWIKVDFEREVRWAMPSFGLGSFSVPSPEWVNQYGASVYVLVDELEGSPNLIWTGFIWKEGQAPVATNTAYPYMKVWLADNWELYINDKPGALSLHLTRTDQKLVLTANDDGFRLVVEDGYVIVDNADIHLGGEFGEKAVMGQTFKTWVNSHTHASGHPGAPTSPPLSPMSTPELSDKVKVVK